MAGMEFQGLGEVSQRIDFPCTLGFMVQVCDGRGNMVEVNGIRMIVHLYRI